jgi:tRNA-binding EMAP/Myf-like protein
VQVVSGLVKHIALEDMQGRRVVIVANLKAGNMRGVRSEAMVLAASSADGLKVGSRVLGVEICQQCSQGFWVSCLMMFLHEDYIILAAGGVYGQQGWQDEGQVKSLNRCIPCRIVQSFALIVC